MTLTHAATVAGADDAPAVRLMAATLRRHHPELALTVLALPGAVAPLRGEEGMTTLDVEALGDDDLLEAIWDKSPTAIGRAARALLVARLLDGGADGVLLLPPDAEVRGRLVELQAALADRDAILVPRLSGSLPDDGERPDAADLLEAGDVDDGLLAVRATEGGRKLVDWWAARGLDAVRRPTPASVPAGPAPDADAGPSVLGAAVRAFAGVDTLDAPGYDVSFWNIHERPIAERDGVLLASGEPLRLIRFTGFRADRPWWFSEHATRVRVLDDLALSTLCRERAAALVGAGWEPPAALGVAAPELANHLRLDERVRRLLAEARDEDEEFGDLLAPAAADRFLAWLAEPAAQGGPAGINRYTYDVWRAREDLREAYPDLDGADADGFVGWLWVHGRMELGLDARLLPEPPDWVPEAQRRPPSVLVAGYLRGALGLGEAARAMARALGRAAVPYGTVTLSVDGPQDERGTARRRDDELAFEDVAVEDPDVLLACVNAPQLPELVERLGPDVVDGRYLVGQWMWEVDVIPPWWDQAFALVDEIWVPSTYTARIVAAASPKPVVVVPLPVEKPAEIAADHGLDVPDAPWTFLFAFDFLSTLQRKNPLGLIEAFTRAFAPGEGPVLVLKTTNARFRPQEVDRLRYAAGGRDDVVMVDGALPSDRLAALFAACDSYVSLHRAEGFGLTLAEAMVLGKPVVATGYSSNVDFMTASNSYLVDYTLTEVGPEAEHYPANGTWAEPSVEHAAQLLREIWEDRDAARARGERGRRDVEAQLNLDAVGAIARKRLERIPARKDDGVVHEALPYPLSELEARLGFPLHAEGGGVKGTAKRAALKAIRPYSVAERQLDEALVASLRHLARRVETLEAERARDRDRLARLERRGRQ
ncbi:glycosyltransferase [Baekduia alba]|uniref:glycosyltransferase n=1 Tax=Baekduia alba TaxID=2997333 RepID=UPI00233F7D69|nr:glycosyltransferase [Baekduia alba]WCB96574.1 glycosyltransferase [Baekduia alba]